MIDRALNGPNAARDAEAATLINQWLQRYRRDNPMNLHNVVPVCGARACSPIPVVLRPPDEYLWEESRFQLSGGGSGIIETAAIDYILPYWMARYYGVIPAVEVQSSAAPTGAIAPDSMASIYGANRATTTEVANTQPPPTSLGGVMLTVTDSSGVARPAPLMYVSPAQINFVVPDGTAPGVAQFTITPVSGSALTTTGLIQSTAPALFDITGEGPGIAAAYAIQTANGVQSVLPVFTCTASTCQLTPIPLGANLSVTLVLYGTGIRNRSSLSNVTANINGINVPVLYAGSQPTYQGFD